MFGIFKSRPSFQPAELVVVDSAPELFVIRDPNVRGSALTEYDLQTMSDYPFVADFMQQYPLTRLNTNQLAITYIDAATEIAEIVAFDGESQVPIADRVYELAFERATADHHMEVADRALTLELNRKYAAQEAHTELRTAIEDNNLVRMAAKAINAHPILAGFMLEAITSRINQK